MNADRVLAHYERLADAPDAISRLRRFVLDLAVRGKLLEQDPSDEPVAELLERIATKKVRLAKASKFKKGTSISPERRFEEGSPIPTTWTSVRLVEISNIVMGQSPPGLTYNTDGDGVPLINGPLEFSEGPFGKTVPNQYTTAPTNSCNKGDFLICVRGSTTGRSNIAAFNACIGRGVAAIQPLFEDRFVRLFLWSMRERIIGMGRGIAFPSITRRQLEDLPIPLPPLAEQHRIVTEVDELMALCDRLEAARTKRETTRNRLATASLARLNAPDPDSATFQNHAAFALENLTPLTTRPDQIKAIRQTILNLPIRGKLVEQDPNDEPASKLMKRIAGDRESFGTIGSLKKPKPLSPIDTANTPFDLPSGWAWVRFPEIGIFGRGKSKHRPRNDPVLYSDGKYPFIQTGDVARSHGSIKTYSSLYNDAGLAQSAMWPAGTLCITIAANIADSGILAFDACFPDSVVGLAVHDCFETAKFFEYFVRTAKGDLQEFALSTAQKNINLGTLTEVLIPIPPLAELRRIVAKIDDLMTLCDRLEESLATECDTRGHVLHTVLHDALSD